MTNAPIYLDFHATTPVDPDVLTAMLPYFSEHFGNAMSGSHAYGWTAAMAVSQARKKVARLIHAEANEIVFTSGATESIHLAILGYLNERDQKGHIITAATEHKCVLEVCNRAKAYGHDVTILDVDRFGQINSADLERAIRPDTALISLMHGNNEIGTVHPIAEIGELASKHGVAFHVDAAQTIGKLPIDVQAMNVDLLSISAHKFYGPKGVGALYVRQSPSRVHLLPYLVGGGQERGLRGGTHNVPGIVGLGAAAEKAAHVMSEEASRLRTLRDKMIARLSHELDDIRLNGHPTERLCNNVSLSIGGVTGDALLALHDVAFSSGSACSSGSAEVSHVMRAIGAVEDRPMSTIRFGLGRTTTEAEIDQVCQRLIKVVTQARQNSRI
ncbi:MAG: cysteine desulfurase [Bdellovibrionaceae bacterium]|nr:cysteine desulfurase [Pseudobdellovibrionaceae bacterium]